MNYRKIMSVLLALTLSTSISATTLASGNNGFTSSGAYYDALKTNEIVFEDGRVPEKIRMYTEEATPEYVILNMVADKSIAMQLYSNDQVGFFHKKDGRLKNKWALLNDIGAKYYIEPNTEFTTRDEGDLFREALDYQYENGGGNPQNRGLIDTIVRKKEGEVIIRVAIPANHPLVKGTKVRKTTYRKKISDGNVQKNGSTSYEVERSVGWSESQIKQLTKTTGVDISVGANFGSKDSSGGSAGVTLSNEISEMFGNSTTYQKNETVKKSETIKGVEDAVNEVVFYQEVSEYEVIPSEALKNTLKKPWLITDPAGGFSGSTQGYFHLEVSDPVETKEESIKSVVVGLEETSFSKSKIR